MLLNYEVCGRGNTLVFLHGHGSCMKDWRLQVDYFCNDYRVVTLDLRGHNQSPSGEGGFAIKQLAQDVIETLDALGIHHAYFIGLSLGALVALAYAEIAPHRVCGLFLANIPPKLHYSDAMIGILRLVLLLFPKKYFVTYLTRRLFPKPEQATLREDIKRHLFCINKLNYLKILFAIPAFDSRAAAHKSQGPIHILTGDRDYWSEARRRALFMGMPQCSFSIIEDSGHASPIDQPEAFNACLAAFLKG